MNTNDPILEYEHANATLTVAQRFQVTATHSMIAHCKKLYNKLSPNTKEALQHSNFDSSNLLNRIALRTLVDSKRDAVTVLRVMQENIEEIRS